MKLRTIILMAACLLLQSGFAQKNAIVNDIRKLTANLLVTVPELEEICAKDFLRLTQEQPESNITNNGLVGGGFYPLFPILHEGSESLGLAEEVKKIAFKYNIGSSMTIYEQHHEKYIYIYSGKGKRGEETAFAMWNIKSDKAAIFIHSPSGQPWTDPVCITLGNYGSEPKPKKRMELCPEGVGFGYAIPVDRSRCIKREDWEKHLDE